MDSSDNTGKEIKNVLVALLHIFEGKPNLLASYLLHYDVFKKEFKDKLIDNSFLKDVSEDLQDSGIIIKPYFTTMESMQDYYNKAFQQSKNQKNNTQVLKAGSDEQALLLQLIEAVEEQDFERAAKIKEYMEELGYNSSISNNT